MKDEEELSQAGAGTHVSGRGDPEHTRWGAASCEWSPGRRWEAMGAEDGGVDCAGEAEAGTTCHRHKGARTGLELGEDAADGCVGGWPGETLGSPLRQRGSC